MEYILDLRTEQVFRLAAALARRRYSEDVLSAQLQEAAISRSLAGAFGGDENLQPWPTWEDQRAKREIAMSGPMRKLREQALA